MRMDEDQSEADASGIFTHADGNSFTQNGNRLGPDESIDIVSNYPALDDDSVIISDDDMASGASSGVYTKKSDPSGRVAVPGASKSDFGKLYDLENSTSDGNTNDIMGEYGTKDSSAHKNLLDDMDNKNTSYFDQPIKTMPTDDSSPGMATHKQTGGIFFNGNEEPSKLCGIPVSRVIMISACFVLIALVVVVASVVASSQNDGGGSTRDTELEDQTDFTGLLTPSPSSPPLEMVPVRPPAPTESSCLPDDDNTSFTVADVEVNCGWLRGKDNLFISVVCDGAEGVDLICTTTCVCGTTLTPTSEPTMSPTIMPTMSPTTTQPSTSSPTPLDFTQFPTSPTDPPTSLPTVAPTTQPTDGPTRLPTVQPTSQPTGAPTVRPTETPTLAQNSPTLSPTFSQAPTIFTTAAPTVLATRPITNVPTSQPTISVDCEDDLPGTIPSSPSFWTCSWLAQTNANFRRAQCNEGDPAFDHCPTTCRSCAP